MLTPDWHPGPRQLRQFGVGVLVLLAGFAGSLWYRSGSLRAGVIPAILGAAVCLIGLLFPFALRPVYRLLALVALPIGWVVSELVLRIVFYVVLTPLGVLFRIMGRDALHLRRRDASTYWWETKREKEPSSYFRQS